MASYVAIVICIKYWLHGKLYHLFKGCNMDNISTWIIFLPNPEYIAAKYKFQLHVCTDKQIDTNNCVAIHFISKTDL